ncbi:carcinoembryonic antigen-related cell adhesion molecule 5 [Cottoperca gobio]|uniref:Carcinoembryonic antigen-related cell adhesion molecule 5 n=1 Tax=Cottoperca gobio TaxID=56716 RepID=A0A6J2QN17_COTGO|nr:carcinoembryonic antigen-related cell adhesion molecule 5-like [Cottoperca gobio]
MDQLAFNMFLFLLSFIGCCAGQSILPDGPVDVILGRNVTLKTLVDKPDFAFMIWNFNNEKDQVHVATRSPTGIKVNKPYEGRVAVNETNGFLTLTFLTSADSGDFSLNIISSDGGTKTGEINLRVLEPVSDVVITSDLSEAIEHNSTVVLTCSAKGSFLKFAWFKGATAIVADDKRFILKEEELSSTLTINGVLRTDLSGQIYCTATNVLEKDKSAAFNLPVNYGPDTVSITPPNPAKFLRSKSNFNLSCSAVSIPPATFNWYQGQQKMEVSGSLLTLEMIEKHSLDLEVKEYTCRATNAKTQRVVPSPAVSFAVMEAISGAKVSGPIAVLIAGNSTANLSCKATAGTVKTTSWQKDGKTLSAGGRLVFSTDMSSIMINPLQKEDNGEYMCQLINPVNTDKASYKMLVNYGPESAMVKGETSVEENDNVVLTCSAASLPPANFTWKFNGTMTTTKTAEFKIEMARYKNSGTYMCEAHNPVTGKTTTYTHTMSVREEGTSEGLSDGAIAGIVIAVLVALGAAIGVIMYCRQKVPVESPY